MNYNKKNNAFSNEQYTIMSTVRDHIVYFWAFVIGILGLVFGQLFFLLPPYFINGVELGSSLEDTINNFSDFLLKYNSVTAFMSELVLIFITSWFFRKVLIKDGKSLVKDWLRNIIIIIVAVGLIVLINELFEYIYVHFNINSDSANQALIDDMLNGKFRIFMILQVAITAPIFEELLFRKFTFGFLDGFKIPGIINVIIVAFVFAFIHCTTENFLQLSAYVYLLNYFSLALVLTLAYYLSHKNIFVSIIIHMINNVMTLVAMCGVIYGLF